MSNENLQRWALIAEIIGGIAIVVSLGVVAFELNQSTRQSELNTEALQIAAYQGLYDSVITLNSSISNDPDMARLVVASQSGDAGLSREDSMRINIFFTNLFRHGDLAFHQFNLGKITEPQLLSVIGPVRGHTRRSATARAIWAGLREGELFQEAFVKYMDEFIANET